MDQQEIYELHYILLKFFEERGKTPKDVISFLTQMWVGQMRLNGYSEKFVDDTLDHMKKSWINHRLAFSMSQ